MCIYIYKNSVNNNRKVIYVYISIILILVDRWSRCSSRSCHLELRIGCHDPGQCRSCELASLASVARARTCWSRTCSPEWPRLPWPRMRTRKTRASWAKTTSPDRRLAWFESTTVACLSALKSNSIQHVYIQKKSEKFSDQMFS